MTHVHEWVTCEFVCLEGWHASHPGVECDGCGTAVDLSHEDDPRDI